MNHCANMHVHPAAALVLGCLLAACAADPPPRVADDLDIEIPERWNGQQTSPPDGERSIAWWREFGDARLDALVTAGLEHNRDLRASLARFEAATAAYAIAGAPLLPEIDASFNADRSRRLFLGFPFGSGGVPATTVTTYGLSLGVRWELDVWGRLRAADAAALADQQAAFEDLQAAQLSLIGQICRGWFAAIEARQQLELAESTAAALRSTLEDVRDRYRRGVRPALEVHQAATNLANAEANVAQRRELLQRARRQLDLLVGRYPAGATATKDDVPTRLTTLPAGMPSELLLRRPDLRAAERRVAAAGCRVDAARAAMYPRLALTASGGTTSLDLEDLVDSDFRAWSIGANLLEPLFRGGALRAEAARRQALRAEALANYESAVLRAFTEVEDILATESELAARRASLFEAADHAAKARDLARERWQLGLTDFLAVADGQRQAFLAESTRIAVDRQRLENRIDLLLALGGGYGAPPIGESP